MGPNRDLNDTFVRFMKDSSVHGLRRILHSNSKVRKFVWILIITAAIGCLTYNCCKVVNEYYEYPTALVVQVEDPKEMEFPAVSICVLQRSNYFHRKMRKQHQKVPNINQTRYVEREQEATVFNPVKGNRSGNLKLASNSNDKIDPFEIEHYVKYVESAEDTILSCSFDLKTCTHEDFKEWKNEDYGKCYTFNDQKKSEPIKKTMKFGSTSGIHLVIRVLSNSSETQTSGIRTIVHSPKEYPFPQEDGINVPSCMLADIAITKTVINRIKPPHGTCTTDTSIFQWKEMFGDLPYSRKGCVRTCHLKQVLEVCNCTLNHRISEKINKNTIHCKEIPEKDECSERVLSLAECDCLPACEEEVFDTSVSYSQLIVKDDCQKYEKCEDSSCYDIDIMAIHVYYKDLSYENKRETPTYTVAALISNLGGTLGICLGLSLITVVELAELIFDLSVVCVSSMPNSEPVKQIIVTPIRDIPPRISKPRKSQVRPQPNCICISNVD